MAGCALLALMALGACPRPVDRAALAALDISSPVVLWPAFDPATTTYTADVSILVQSLDVTAIPASPEAIVTVNGREVAHGEPSPAIPLGLGKNQVAIQVTIPGSKPRLYTITVHRARDIAQQVYGKASRPGVEAYFGWSLALSGQLLAVGAPFESSSATGIGGDEHDQGAPRSGAVYLFRHDGSTWAQEAYLKASNPRAGDHFGWNLALDGDLLAVGAPFEDSGATGIDGDQGDDRMPDSGAVYLFRHDGSTWAQEAYLKASNTGENDYFGSGIALSGDLLVVGAPGEDSGATGIDGDQGDDRMPFSGAVYAFRHDGSTWAQEAYLKASNTGENDYFGSSLALSGNTLAVGAFGEDSSATGIDGDGSNDDAIDSGAAYVFTFGDAGWTQEAYVKASNTGAGDTFGSSLALWENILAVGAPEEDGGGTGIGGREDDDTAPDSGAVYVFVRDAQGWRQEAYVKASNASESDFFGSSVALHGDVLAVAATGEASGATGVDADQHDDSAYASGAVYVFLRIADRWRQRSYVKASNTAALDLFGFGLALSDRHMVAGAVWEDGSAAGIGASQQDRGTLDSGAIYIFQ